MVWFTRTGYTRFVMQYWRVGMREALGMGSAFIMLNLPLSIVYLYHPESRQWSWLAVLAVPGLILPAMCSVARMFRLQAGASIMAATCVIGGAIAAAGHHMALMVLAHIGIYLGDRVGTTRLPASLQADISFWKRHFAETAGYWLPNAQDMFDLMLMFGGVAALTAAYLIGRQKLTIFGFQPAFAKSSTQAPSHSLKMPV
jgi:hypothetical protein